MQSHNKMPVFQEDTFQFLFGKLKKIFDDKKICIHKTECLEDLICDIAMANSGRRSETNRIINPEAMEFCFLLRLNDAKQLEDYYNNIKPGCASLVDELGAHLTDHRFFPKETFIKLKLDSTVLSSEIFMEALKSKLNSYDEATLKSYQKQSEVLEEKAEEISKPLMVIPKSKPQSSSSWFTPKIVTGVAGLALFSLFAYKMLSKPKEAIDLISGPRR